METPFTTLHLDARAIRVLAQHSATSDDLDASYAARHQDPVAIVQSTFGGASGQGNRCSNGGAGNCGAWPAARRRCDLVSAPRRRSCGGTC